MSEDMDPTEANETADTANSSTEARGASEPESSPDAASGGEGDSAAGGEGAAEPVIDLGTKTTSIDDINAQIDDSLTDDDIIKFARPDHDPYSDPGHQADYGAGYLPPPLPGGAGYLPPPLPGGYGAPPPEGSAYAAPRQLVRDPYSPLGGVASGVAHYFGIDVALVRIGFVIGAVMTGIGFLAYLLAWMIIPRAKHWPPNGPPAPAKSPRSITGRQFSIGLLCVGVLMALGLSGGPGEVMAPLVIIGAGIWLLRQSPTTVAMAAAAPVAPPPGGPAVQDTVRAPTSFEQISTGTYRFTPPPPAPPTGQPVHRRSLLGRSLRAGIVVALVVIPLGVLGLLAVALSSGAVDVSFTGEDIVAVPASVAELAPEYSNDIGKIELDLTRLDSSMFAEGHAVVLNIGAGDIVVIVPDDLAVSVDAGVGAGKLQVFDTTQDGLDNSIQIDNSDAVLDLKAHADIGHVEIKRG